MNLIITDYLKQKGLRITKIRKAVLEVFSKENKPISVTEILEKLYEKDLSANKVTIYREVELLRNLNIIGEYDFGDGKKRYELIGRNHHHHLICVKCAKVEDVSLNIELREEEKKILNEKGFKVREHSLEFFGVCKKCQ